MSTEYIKATINSLSSLELVDIMSCIEEESKVRRADLKLRCPYYVEVIVEDSKEACKQLSENGFDYICIGDSICIGYTDARQRDMLAESGLVTEERDSFGSTRACQSSHMYNLPDSVSIVDLLYLKECVSDRVDSLKVDSKNGTSEEAVVLNLKDLLYVPSQYRNQSLQRDFPTLSVNSEKVVIDTYLEELFALAKIVRIGG